MPLILIVTIYQLLQLIALPFIIVTLIILHIKRGIIGNLWQRIGFVPCSGSDKKGPIIWIHTVSVGETLSVEHFINTIKKTIPDAQCYLTVGTIAGKKIAQTHLKGADWISYLPYDFLPCMLMAYRRIRPSALLIAEAELWPNLLTIAHYKKIRLIWINARINPYSRTRYLTFRRFFTPLMSCFTRIFAQSTYDQKEFISMGVAPEKILVLGNLKTFNVMEKKAQYLTTHTDQPSLLQSYGAARNSIANNKTHRILLVGSMHPGEDVIYLNLFTSLKPIFPDLKLIFAPRHFGWQKQLEAMVASKGLTYKVWSKETPLVDTEHQPLAQALHTVLADNDILLVCKLGKLFALYPHATIYALGGTFIPVGGHNLLESAVWGIPTIIGPFYQNCKDIADRLETVTGIIKVTSEDALLTTTKNLLEDPDYALRIGHNSLAWLERENEQVKKQLFILLGMLR